MAHQHFDSTNGRLKMQRILVFAYGVTSYLIALVVFVYLAGFLGNILVPNSVDAAPVGPLWEALVINTLLIAAFGVQHTVMARPRFKELLSKIVPAPAE